MDMSKAAKNAAPEPDQQAQPASYEAALQELEQLVSRMESGQMPLAGMLQSYQRGAFLLEHCRSRLQAVEAQIQVLEAGSLKNWAGGSE
jgi:exodeoxyribonuclease VII small subunit